MARKGATVNLFDGGSVAVHPDMAKYANQQPRGWPPGSTWEQVPGVADGKNIYVAVDSDNHGSGSIMLHEFGHAVDAANGYLVDKPAWKTAYDAVVAVHKDDLSPYFLQEGHAGLSEMWAEVFVHWGSNGQSSTKSMQKVLATPEGKALLAVMTQLIDEEISK
jgi:toxin lethal factor